MNYVIAGCGRLGSMVASMLDAKGHNVFIIDLKKSAFERLDDAYKGQKIVGSSFNLKVLKKAKITEADGFIAVTNGDNTNIISSRTVKMKFGIENIVARIYDSKRAEIYSTFGIAIIATAKYGAHAILKYILPDSQDVQYRDATGDVLLAKIFRYENKFIGQKICELEEKLDCKIPYINRNNNAFITDTQTILQEKDILNIICAKDDYKAILEKLKEI
jgi:trk system potassium uptake protein TrkA